MSFFTFLAGELMNDINAVSKGPAQELYCRLWLTRYFMWTMIDGSTFNLTVITVERFMAIRSPLTYDNHVVRKRLPLMILLIWLTGIILLLPFPLTSTVRDGYCSVDTEYPTDGWRRFSLSVTMVAVFLIPFTLMVSMYISMGVILRRTIQGGNSKYNNYVYRFYAKQYEGIKKLMHNKIKT